VESQFKFSHLKVLPYFRSLSCSPSPDPIQVSWNFSQFQVFPSFKTCRFGPSPLWSLKFRLIWVM